MILSNPQAEAVYSAMCALNKVSALARNIEMQDRHQHTIQVRENSDGRVVVTLNTGGVVLDSNIEFHASQSALATAYGLNRHGEDGEADQGYSDGYAGRPMAMCMKGGRYATQYRNGEADRLSTTTAYGLESARNKLQALFATLQTALADRRHFAPNTAAENELLDAMATVRSLMPAAYSLNGDEPQSAVAAAAGGLTQTAIEH